MWLRPSIDNEAIFDVDYENIFFFEPIYQMKQEVPFLVRGELGWKLLASSVRQLCIAL